MKRKEIRKKLKAMVAQLVADRINPNALLEVAERLRNGETVKLMEMTPVEDAVLFVYDSAPIGQDVPRPIVSRLASAAKWKDVTSLQHHCERLYTDGVPIDPREAIAVGATGNIEVGMCISSPGVPELDGKVIIGISHGEGA